MFPNSGHSYLTQNKWPSIFFGMRSVLCVRFLVIQHVTPRMIHFHQKVIHLSARYQHGLGVPGCSHCLLKRILVSPLGLMIIQCSILSWCWPSCLVQSICQNLCEHLVFLDCPSSTELGGFFSFPAYCSLVFSPSRNFVSPWLKRHLFPQPTRVDSI